VLVAPSERTNTIPHSSFTSGRSSGRGDSEPRSSRKAAARRRQELGRRDSGNQKNWSVIFLIKTLKVPGQAKSGLRMEKSSRPKTAALRLEFADRAAADRYVGATRRTLEWNKGYLANPRRKYVTPKLQIDKICGKHAECSGISRWGGPLWVFRADGLVGAFVDDANDIFRKGSRLRYCPH